MPIPRKILRYDFDTISILIPSDTILLIPRKFYDMIRYDSDSHTQRNDIADTSKNSTIWFDTISLLIPSDTIFADTSKNSTIRYDIDSHTQRYNICRYLEKSTIWFDRISILIPSDMIFADTSKNSRLRFDMILILIPSDTILAKILRYDYDSIQYWFSYPAIRYLLIPRKILRFDTISILIPSDTIFADTSKNYTIRLRFDTISILIPSDMIFADTSETLYDTISILIPSDTIFADTSKNATIYDTIWFLYPAIRYLPIPQKMLWYIRYDIDLIPSDTIFADTSKNYTIRFDTITILIPSDTIFADTSKNLRYITIAIRYLPIPWKIIRYDYDSIQEYIDLYIDIMILYTYFKQPSTFLLTHNVTKIYNMKINLKCYNGVLKGFCKILDNVKSHIVKTTNYDIIAHNIYLPQRHRFQMRISLSWLLTLAAPNQN